MSSTTLPGTPAPAFCLQILRFVFLIALAATPATVLAQWDESPCDANYATANCAGVTAPYTDPEHEGAPWRNEVQITVGDDGERASLTLGGKLGAGFGWNFTVSSPLNEAGDTQLATLDGLGNGTKVAFELSRQVGGDFTPARKLFCSVPNVEAKVKKELSTLALMATSDENRPAAATNCTEVVATAMVEKDVTLQRDIAVSAYDRAKPVKRYGARVGAGYDEFGFLDPDYIPTSTHEVGYSLGAHYSITDVQSGWAFVASVSRQSAYRNVEGSLVEVCTPVPGSPAQRCYEGFSEPPTRAQRTVTALEGRWLLKKGRSAVSVRVSRDHTSGVTGVSVPIYLLVNADKELAGGIKLGWRSDTDEAQFGVFVSSAFNL